MTDNPLVNVPADAAQKGATKTLFERLEAYKTEHHANWLCFQNEGDCVLVYRNGGTGLFFHNTGCPNSVEYVAEMIKVNNDVCRAVRVPVDYEFSYGVSYEPVTSTNDFLILKSAGLTSKLLSVAILFFQIAMMVLAITNTYAGPAANVTPTLIFVRLFISVYLGFKMANGMSDAIDGVFNTALSAFPSDELCMKIFIGLFMMIMSVPVLYAQICAELYASVSGTPSSGKLRGGTLLVVCEYTLIIVSVVATIVITRQQSGLVESIFNFVGLLLILELDDLVASAIKYHVRVLSIECVHTSELKTDFLTHKYFLAGVVFVVTFISLIV